MTLIELINSYDRWTRFNPMTSNQHSMFFAISRIWNACGRQEWLSVPNTTVAEMSGIKNSKTLQDTRDKLVSMGLIAYKKGSRNSYAAQYCITPKNSPLLAFVVENESKSTTKTTTKRSAKPTKETT